MTVRPARKIRLEDVAEAAGVSRATASRVISRTGPASPAVQDRVRNAARQLGYQPDQVARSLAGGAGFRLVVAIVGTTSRVLDDPYVDRALAAAAETAAPYGVGVSLQWLPRRSPRLDRLAEDRSVRGVVLFNTTEATLAGMPAALNRRVASIGIGSPSVPSFDVDNGGAASTIVRHLYGIGRRRIAMITGPPWLPCAWRSVKAYQDLVRSAGLPVRLVAGDFSAAGGQRGMRIVLRRWPDTDAVFAINDATALGAIAVLRETGRLVPDDIAVAGFDDIPFAELSAPALTTASHPVGAIVSAAVTAVLDGSRVPPAAVFPSTLVRRASA
ncbi:LacI family transcriptional regulator [Micromonospora sp. NBC_01699]|uniref:LacI family DNA-binding transcriptional regulator n=1 Tax=Micromonospora sp. NBC_01699 TaxID=2975984 RepID=UPI002E35D0FB|nr:LacI family DNA-binding transcriptional regulator [Micromonospora sp. NBC_01699]